MKEIFYLIVNICIGAFGYWIADYNRRAKFFNRNNKIKEKLWYPYKLILLSSLFILMIRILLPYDNGLVNLAIIVLSSGNLYIAIKDICELSKAGDIKNCTLKYILISFLLYTILITHIVINKLPIYFDSFKSNIKFTEPIQNISIIIILNLIIVVCLISITHTRRNLDHIIVTLKNQKKINANMVKVKKKYLEVYTNNSMTIIYKEDILKIKYVYKEKE